MVLDTQGSELLILQSAETILDGFNFIQVEAANFEAYRNCATVDTINSFLRGYGFRLLEERLQARRKAGAEYFELLFVIPDWHRLLRRLRGLSLFRIAACASPLCSLLRFPSNRQNSGDSKKRQPACPNPLRAKGVSAP